MTTMSHPEISLAFSPDSDDAFMFWPLLNGKIESGGIRFSHRRADTAALNRDAEVRGADVIALSIAHYPAVAEQYMLLPHGASVGRGYGPVVVAREAVELASLRGKVIAIPGKQTTAFAVLRLLLSDFIPREVSISPYSRMFDAVRTGEVDAALVIHEGRLTYEREGMKKVVDIGAKWSDLTGGLPLPLGGNAIARDLGAEMIARVSDLCRKSIAWGLAHRDEVIDALLSAETRGDLPLDRATLDRYLAMYANADTLEMADDSKRAVTELFTRMRACGALKREVVITYAP